MCGPCETYRFCAARFPFKRPPEALVYSARRRGDVVSEGIQAEGPWKSRDWLFHVFHGAESVH
jgi:hypothetical protein